MPQAGASTTSSRRARSLSGTAEPVARSKSSVKLLYSNAAMSNLEDATRLSVETMSSGVSRVARIGWDAARSETARTMPYAVMRSSSSVGSRNT